MSTLNVQISFQNVSIYTASTEKKRVQAFAVDNNALALYCEIYLIDNFSN